MIFPQTMKQLVAVVLERDADRVTRVLLDQGVMHFVSVTEVDPGLSQRLSAGSPKVTEAMIAEIRRRIEGLFSLAGQGPPAQADLRVEDLRALDLGDTNRQLDELAASAVRHTGAAAGSAAGDPEAGGHPPAAESCSAT